MAKVVKYDDRIQFRIKKEEKIEVEKILLKENKSLADFFRAAIDELLKRK